MFSSTRRKDLPTWVKAARWATSSGCTVRAMASMAERSVMLASTRWMSELTSASRGGMTEETDDDMA